MTPRIHPHVDEELSDRTTVAKGFLGILSLFDVVYFVSSNRLTGVLRITNDDRTGYLEFRKGRLLAVNEWAGEHSEETAIELFQWQTGIFEFRSVPVDTDQIIPVTTENYLMGMAKRVDEIRKGMSLVPDKNATTDQVRSEYMSLIQKTRGEKTVTYPLDSDCARTETGRPMPDFDHLLQEFVRKGGTTLHLKPDTAPRFVKDGESFFLNYSVMPISVLERFCENIAENKWRTTAGRDFHAELPYSLPGTGHFILRVARDFGYPSIAVRAVKSEIPDFADLNLPVEHFSDICARDKGLILVSGPPASGVSTTIASIIDFLNSTRAGMIVAFEQRCDYRHQNILSIINQIKVDFCNPDFITTMRYGLQLEPDIILIERLFNSHIAHLAIEQASNSRLVISTIAAHDCAGALENAVKLFRATEKQDALEHVADTLTAVISQRLTKGKNGRPVPHVEMLIPDDESRAHIASGRFADIRESIRHTESRKHLSFEQSASILRERGLL